MASLHPEFGARIVLEREDARGRPLSEHEPAPPERGARYRVSVVEPDAAHVGLADVDDDGGVHWSAWSSAPPRWAELFAERLLKGLAKKHAPDGSWPRKLVRWREPLA